MYMLDNEPTLWNSTHRDVHPDPVGYEELLDRTLEGALFEWLDAGNHAVDYQVYARTAANIWSLVLDVKNNSAVVSQHVFSRVRARIFRLDVTRFSDQQRLLIRRFELYEAHPLDEIVEMPRRRGRLFRFFRRKLRR